MSIKAVNKGVMKLNADWKTGGHNESAGVNRAATCESRIHRGFSRLGHKGKSEPSHVCNQILGASSASD